MDDLFDCWDGLCGRWDCVECQGGSIPELEDNEDLEEIRKLSYPLAKVIEMPRRS